MLSKTLTLLKTELKHNFISLILANLIIIGIIYFIFGVNNLDSNAFGMIVERFLPIIGIFYLATLFFSEQKKPIKDILIMRSTRLEFIYFVRFLLRFILYFLVSFMYVYSIKEELQISEVLKLAFHSISIGMFMGVIGLFIFSITNNISLGFLTSITLMLMQWFYPKNKAKSLLLFTMPDISSERMIFIFGIFILILIVAMKIWKKKKIS